MVLFVEYIYDISSEVMLGHRTLNQRVVGSNPGEGTAWYLCDCEQDTLKSTARGSQNKQICLRHVPLTSVKKTKKLE
jgi:hypothetical protein